MMDYLKDFTPPEEDCLDEEAARFQEEIDEENEQIYKSNSQGLGYGYDLPESAGSGTYNPKKLSARHREMLRLVSLGYKNITVGKILGVTPQNVSDVINSPLGQSFLAEIQDARTGSVKEVHDRLQEMSPLASEVMLDIMADGKSESNRLRAAEKVLEMTGHKAGNKHFHLHSQLNADEISQLKEAANKGPRLVKENNEPEEAQFEDVTDEEDEDI